MCARACVYVCVCACVCVYVCVCACCIHMPVVTHISVMDTDFKFVPNFV